MFYKFMSQIALVYADSSLCFVKRVQFMFILIEEHCLASNQHLDKRKEKVTSMQVVSTLESS